MCRKALRCESQSPQTSCPTLSYRPRKWPRMLCTPAKDKANVVHRKLMNKQCKKNLKGSNIYTYSPTILAGESLYNTSQKGKHEAHILFKWAQKQGFPRGLWNFCIFNPENRELHQKFPTLCTLQNGELPFFIFNCLWKTPWSYFKIYSIDYYKM